MLRGPSALLERRPPPPTDGLTRGFEARDALLLRPRGPPAIGDGTPAGRAAHDRGPRGPSAPATPSDSDPLEGSAAPLPAPSPDPPRAAELPLAPVRLLPGRAGFGCPATDDGSVADDMDDDNAFAVDSGPADAPLLASSSAARRTLLGVPPKATAQLAPRADSASASCLSPPSDRASDCERDFDCD